MTAKHIKAKLIKRGPKVDMSQWGLEATEKIGGLGLRLEEAAEKIIADIDFYQVVTDAVTEAFNIAAEEGLDVHFPAEWNIASRPSNGRGGRPPSDAMQLYIGLSLAEYTDDRVGFECSLRDCVERAIEFSCGAGGKIDRDEYRGVVAIMDGLRELANMIEAKLQTK